MKKKKVFCKYCKYYAIVNPGAISGTSAQDACNHATNIRTQKVPDSSYEPEHIAICGYRQTASEINHNNNCKYYKAN